MPRKRTGKKLTTKKSSSKKSKANLPKEIDKESYNSMRKWAEDVKNANLDYQFDAEIVEINSDEESDEFECNLKDLEKPLKSLLKKCPDSFLKKRVFLECEWDKCDYETVDEIAYNNHVHDHLVSLDRSQELKCLWNLCKIETENSQELLRHLDYHAYHSRLKNFGLGLTNILAVPNCQLESKRRNVIPKLPSDYFCYWKGCAAPSYTKYNEFLEHVNYHLKDDYQAGVASCQSDRSEKLSSIRVTCEWDGCSREMRNVFLLKRHLKSHTNEKMIGCANCGALFINKPMFISHCIRQVVNQRSFQCPDCFKFYPSEKLLKDHARSHVNKFQCSMCGLSCQKKSVLARHIRYRHMADKPFACDECDYKGKTKRDLDAHKNVHNQDEFLFKCDVFQCSYVSRTVMALKRHDAKEHDGQPQTYQCHCCDKQYPRGYLLSKHLRKVHAFKLAPGHSRFIYKRDLDGLYRLQTKRVENLKGGNIRLVTPKVDDSQLEVSYEIDKITNTPGDATPINVRMKKVIRSRWQAEKSTFSLFNEESTEDSKDINDFAIVKKYKKIIKRKKLEQD